MKINKKKITTYSATALLTLLLTIGGISVLPDNLYMCEDTNAVRMCDSFSRPNPLIGNLSTRCYFTDEEGYKTYSICRSGWIDFRGWANISDSNYISISAKNRSVLIGSVRCWNENGELTCSNL